MWWDTIISDLGEFNSLPVTTSLASAQQALYKLYNVAANHRHLYHHAFPGPQVEEAAEEQDKKRDWLDKTEDSRDLLVMDTRRRRRNILTHSFGLVLAGVAHQYIHYFKPNNRLHNVHV